jgi:ankyrin repeat protein
MSLAQEDNLEALKEALAKSTEADQYCVTQTTERYCSYSSTPLIMAIQAKKKRNAAYLLSDANPQRAKVLASINYITRNAYSYAYPSQYDAITAAVCWGDLDTLKLLLAIKEVEYPRNDDGETLLTVAIRKENYDAIAYLLSDANPKKKIVLETINLRNKDGEAPIHIAAKLGSSSIPKILHLLLAQRETEYNENLKGATPLIVAVQYGQDEVVAYLLSAQNPRQDEVKKSLDALVKLPVSDSANHKGTALWFAVNNGRVKSTLALLQAGASPNVPGIYNEVVTSALSRSIAQNFHKITALLLIYGANLTIELAAKLSLSHLTAELCTLMDPANFSDDFEKADRCLAFLAFAQIIPASAGVLIHDELAKKFALNHEQSTKLQTAANRLAKHMQHYLQEKGEAEIKRHSRVDLAELARDPIQKELNSLFENELTQFIHRKKRVQAETSKSGGDNYEKRIKDFATLIAEIENNHYADKPMTDKARDIKVAIDLHVKHYQLGWGAWAGKWVNVNADHYQTFLTNLLNKINSASDEVIVNFAQDIVKRLTPYHANCRSATGTTDETLLAVVQDMERRAKFTIMSAQRTGTPQKPPSTPTATAPELPPLPADWQNLIKQAGGSPLHAKPSNDPPTVSANPLHTPKPT